MAEPQPSPPAAGTRRKGDSRREREFLWYAEAVLGMRSALKGDVAVSSIDLSLTAFAQLVTLRLNAKRALISLYDKRYQYVLAEATRTLSLQHDHVHHPEDSLYFGTTVLKRGDDLGSQILKHQKSSEGKALKDPQAFVVPDLQSDERFKNHRFAVDEPHVRAYAGVPILTPGGFPIGTLTLMDDKPRPDGFNDVEVEFLHHVATSVSMHLEMMRTKLVHQRGTRMVNGLSRFMEGKSTVDDVHVSDQQGLNALAKQQHDQTAALGASKRTQALNSASNTERYGTAQEGLRNRGKTPNRPPFKQRPSQPDEQTNSKTHGVEAAALSGLLPAIGSAHAPLDPSSEPIPSYPINKEIAQVFWRAAGIIQQAMDVSGVLFLDATASEFNSIRSKENPSPEGSETLSTTSSSRPPKRSTDCSRESPRRSQKCRYLGAAFATQDAAALSVHGNLSEKYLRSLLRRFPYGRVWKFGEDGLLSSDEHSSGSGTEGNASEESFKPAPIRPRKRGRADPTKLIGLFPGVRSLSIMPIWDAHRGRFYGCALVWSYSRTRVLTYSDDQCYIGGFCDLVMAEVSRLELQVDVATKTSFISSISHELRSPLHGVIGAADCLRESDDPASRTQMLQIIDSCGRSLLDIINNLLDHADSAGKKHAGGQYEDGGRRFVGKASTSVSEPVHNLAVLTEETLQTALWSTPTPAPPRLIKSGPARGASHDETIRVILDIDNSTLEPGKDWNFHVNSGAWRRIIQNLSSNACKYTAAGGYLRVALSVRRETGQHRAKASLGTMVDLEVRDSGRGMSKEYLQHGLWEAFHQEESQLPGTGLGLSLVRDLVESMGGSIQVDSTKNVGTCVRVSVPLVCSANNDESSERDASQYEGLTFGLVGFDVDSEHSSRAGESNNLFRSSAERTCMDLGLRAFDAASSDKREPDVYIVTENKALSADELNSQVPAIVLCNSVQSSRVVESIFAGWVKQAVVVSQPLGPLQLIRALRSCFSTQTTAPMRPALGTPPMMHRDSSSGVDDITSTDEASTVPTVSAIAQTTVLLVDDNPVNLALLSRYMKKLGRAHITAGNGREAVNVFKQAHAQSSPAPTDDDATGILDVLTHTRPGVVFMDINMPIMDGLEAARQIRSFERANKLKGAVIVALTAMASAEARQEAYSSGIDLFLTKPVRMREIQKLFQDWEQEVADVTPIPTPADVLPSPVPTPAEEKKDLVMM